MGLGASEAARWQAAQTRVRMGAGLWLTFIKVALLSWLALTMYVVWYKTDAYYPGLQHRYFWRWVIGGTFTTVPILDRLGGYLKLPIEGGWYPLPEVTAWLNSREVYHASFGFWFGHFCRYTALLPLGIGALLIAIRIRLDSDAEHVRGLKLLRPGRHNRQLNGGWLARGRRAFDRAIFVRQALHHSGIKLGTSIIPENKECEHFLVTGSPGAGKSTLIRHMLAQIERRGQSAIVIDPDCEFVQEFYDERRGDVLLNPLDRRCPFWSPCSNSVTKPSPGTPRRWPLRLSGARHALPPKNSSGNPAGRWSKGFSRC